MAVQGTDGARGLFIESLEITQGDNVLSIGDVAGYSMALAEMAGPGSTIVMGRDTRPSGDVLKRYATAGIEAAGGIVIDVGVAPTPAIQKIALQLGAAGAISLTPSHNPHTDAGWKGMLDAKKPSKEKIKEIEDTFEAIVARGGIQDLDPGTYDANKHSQPHLLGGYIDAVIDDVRQLFDNERPLEGKLVVVDTARGAANEVSPVIMERLGADVVRFACDTDGLINDNCGATHLGGLEQFLRERPELMKHPKFIGAFGNDGDADRVMGLGVDFKGGKPVFHVLDGNIGLELLAPGQPGVVGTDYTNDASIKRIRESGVNFEFCRNGDANVTRALQQRGWWHGAEFSGHIVDRKWLDSGDGPRMAAIYLATAALHDTTFAEICRKKPLNPELMLSVKLPNGAQFNIDLIEEVLDPTPEDVENDFRHMTRKSGTEPIVRIWGVGRRRKYVKRRVNGIAGAVRHAVTY